VYRFVLHCTSYTGIQQNVCQILVVIEVLCVVEKCYASMGSKYQLLCSCDIMCTLKRHALQNYAVFYACIGSSFKSVLIGV